MLRHVGQYPCESLECSVGGLADRLRDRMRPRGRMTGQRGAMVGRVGSMACVGSRARQGEAEHGKAWEGMLRHGTAWHGMAWERAWVWAWQLNNLQPDRAGRPSLAVSKHGRRAEGESERKDQSVFVCARACRPIRN